VFALLIVGVVVVVAVLYAADRFIKARAQTRRLRTMSERLDAATKRTDKKIQRRLEVARASTELTSVIPAINRPPLSLPDEPLPREPAPGESSLDEPAFDEAEPRRLAAGNAAPDLAAPDLAVPDGVAVRETGPDATAVLGAPLDEVLLDETPVGQAPRDEPGPAGPTREDQEPCTADPLG
jgi:hypothetical protein